MVMLSWMPPVAERLGMTAEAYEARYDAGERWCSGCKTWHPIEHFGPDKNRPSGLNRRCRVACRKRDRERLRKAREKRERPEAQVRATDALRHVLGMVRRGRSHEELEERILEAMCGFHQRA